MAAAAPSPAAPLPTVAAVDRPRATALGAGMTLLGVVRILLGLTFLWAFLDKTFGLGFSTPAERAWIAAGSPTPGFPGGSIEAGNPLAGLWEFWLALNPVTDVLFMAGLLGIGLALTLGIGMRIAAVSGALLYAMMYLAALPLTTNPVIDDHLVMGVLVVALALLGAGGHVGLGRRWQALVGTRAPWLI